MSAATIPAVGVEEEFHILDLVTRQLVPRAQEILARLPADRFTGELLRSVVETNSRPVVDLAELRADLVWLRGQLAAAAEPLGLGPLAAGTAPIVDLARIEVSDDPRYQQMAAEYQVLAREQVICGAHVHVNVADRDTALEAVGAVARWLPVLLAISASSPFWLGVDSGYASVRTLVWQRWPTAGGASAFAGAAEYDQLVTDLVKSGVILDPGMIYFDLRPSSHLPTVELRICDACPDVDTVILIVGLFRALVSEAVAAIEEGRPLAGSPRPELLRAATWRAARCGLEGELVELPAGGGAAPVPARELLGRLLAHVRPALDAAGDWELVSALAERQLRRGSAAARARRAFRRHGQLAAVADLGLVETRQAGTVGTLAAGRGVGGQARADRVAPRLLAGYRPAEATFDEAVDQAGNVRPPYRALLRTLERLGPRALAARAAARAAEQTAQRVVFRVAGAAAARPFPLDLVPRIVDEADWAVLRAGLVQRARALEAFLRDAYADRLAVADGVLPGWVVAGSPGLRCSGRSVPAATIRASVLGVDLVRGHDGRWLVLEDNLRVPSGVAYAMAARRLTRSALPELGPPPRVGEPDAAPSLLRSALAAAAPPAAAGRDEPSMAVLTSGAGDAAYFEHTVLAAEMGLPLVEPADLLVRDDGVTIPATGEPGGGQARRGEGGRRPVDVLYRRIDEDELFAAAGADGVPLGRRLPRALATGKVSLANAPGNGVADDKAVYAYVDRLIRYYLGEAPLLGQVATYPCGDPDQLDHVLRHLGELVVKPVDGYGGADVLIGPRAGPGELAAARARLIAEPRRWVGQELVALSTHPTWASGALWPRPVDLRAFVYQGERAVVAPVALTRVAPAGSILVNSSRGGGCKDTWLPRDDGRLGGARADVCTERPRGGAADGAYGSGASPD
ncbi:MAG: carboxylate--amine ligase/circularly permuted type 2 ATP-grasp protein [Frankia sp.]|nr:carboxylate--amine ligase/circularly permuted type 2 ATP-grasp protein [Frankia sp.]